MEILRIVQDYPLLSGCTGVLCTVYIVRRFLHRDVVPTPVEITARDVSTREMSTQTQDDLGYSQACCLTFLTTYNNGVVTTDIESRVFDPEAEERLDGPNREARMNNVLYRAAHLGGGRRGRPRPADWPPAYEAVAGERRGGRHQPPHYNFEADQHRWQFPLRQIVRCHRLNEVNFHFTIFVCRDIC